MSIGSPLSSQSGLDEELAAALAKSESTESTPDSQAAPPLSEDLLESDWSAQYESIQTLLEQLKAASSRPLQLLVNNQQPSVFATGPEEQSANAPSSNINWLSWIVISSGLMLFVCGVILVVWSIVAQREELWRVGLPITLVGQATLVIGGALQLESLWVSNRHTHRAIERLGGELQRLQVSTKLLTTARNAAAQSYYAHHAEHISPHIMLADLKGQLDSIAIRLSRREEPE